MNYSTLLLGLPSDKQGRKLVAISSKLCSCNVKSKLHSSYKSQVNVYMFIYVCMLREVVLVTVLTDLGGIEKHGLEIVNPLKFDIHLKITRYIAKIEPVPVTYSFKDSNWQQITSCILFAFSLSITVQL